ncbi:flagellar motor switch protein FliG [Buchnera aphidicola str. Bp (Baizongia pistaciae)]|uniref:Flagellar motor switch protein FliG n=1 Tax=Buchnera aphidicola subsp. Baizongia pistaciae (strain Bp) TaxID=224915 RepID=FLIG_BUCBP|nr:FliG C-terminal domain-containing protein [Buchnera aphidicola]Q89AZ9.1 RecName: Full=Flagellar motor switch protein FliG [Buchnera aphidicola str. Bp (Baizongia pistaciae)]AAO26805.1 flagellar motor switch protein FliG [Buchnera aphidicola str. Bp (Baizongia pistaciae)]
MNLNGEQKSAVLLALVGIDKAIEILKELSIQEIENIAKCMSYMDVISSITADLVLSEFCNEVRINKDQNISFINNNFIISLLKKVLGEHHAVLLLDKFKNQKNISDNIKKLNLINPEKIVSLIKGEHPQIIATILIYLNRNHAANILSYFEDNLSLDIIRRIANFSSLKKLGQEEFVKIIDNLINKYQNSMLNQQGIVTAVELLKLIKRDQETKILTKMFSSDKVLAKRIKTKMLEFSDIINLDDVYIRRLIKVFPLYELSEIMKVEKEEFKKKFYKNMSLENTNLIKNYCSKKIFISNDLIQKKRNNLLNSVKKILYNS